MGNYKELDVWNLAMDLTTEVYQLTRKLPNCELYALSDQMRRAAVSIPSNIAEGQARSSDKEFSHFLTIARGSGAELETQLLLCVRLGYFEEEEIRNAVGQIQRIQKMISSLKRSLSMRMQG